MGRSGRNRVGTRLAAALLAGLVVAAGGAAAGGAAVARADVVWLCGPQVRPEEDPCRGSMETTVTSPEGATRVQTPPVDPKPRVDCFYVYPTVSGEPGMNASKDRDPEVIAIAKHQAARFSQHCRVFAPVYRQQTLLALGAGGSATALHLAYGDVVEAWNDYLLNHNRGRPFVLIGHSQGTRMLRRLLREQIETREELLARLVSAVLPGGNVLVRRGEPWGGDFRRVMACMAPGQTGCVIAYSAFNETPPANARYGRPNNEMTDFGFSGGPEYEVLCTNPASLVANDRARLHTLLRTDRFPGFLGLLMTQMYGGPPPSAPTPWLEPQDHYSARCETRDGANVLMVEPIGTARRLNPAPDASWGLHLADVSLALGDLVAAVGRQVEAFLPAFVVLRPDLRLRARCTGRRARITISGTDVAGVHRVDFRLGRRLVARDSRAPFRVRLRRGARGRLRAVVQMSDGRRATYQRGVRC